MSRRVRTYTIAPDHPSLPGHFPDHPVVPGVVILEQVMALAEQELQVTVTGVTAAKFLAPLLPGQSFEVRLDEVRAGRLRFECVQEGQALAAGQLRVQAPP